MDRRELGRTGLHISSIGFGAFKIGRNEGVKYPQGYALPDESAAARLLNMVLDLGINYIDTAPAYGLSEERIGKALAHRRHEFVLSTKVGETFADGKSTYDFSAAAITRSIETSLRRLQRDVLDLVFVHAHGDDLAILRGTDVVEALRKLKTAGRIRALGFSGKTPAAARLALDWCDALMVEYSLVDQSHAEVIAQAEAAGVGVVVKKGLASGRLDANEAVRFVLGRHGVTSLLIGSLNGDHLKDAIAAATVV